MLPPFLSSYHRKSLSMEIFLHLETSFSIWKQVSHFGNIILHLETRFSIQKHHSPFGNTCYSCKIEVFEAVQMFFSLCFGLFRCFEEISSSHRLISEVIRLWEPAFFLFSFTLYKSKYCAKKRIFSLFFQKSKETLKIQGFDKDGSKKPVKSRLCGQQQAMRQLKLNKFTGQGYRFHQWYPFSVAPR